MKKTFSFKKINNVDEVIKRSNIPHKLRKKILKIDDKRDYLWAHYEYQDKVIIDCAYDRLSLYDGDDNTLVEKIVVDKNCYFHKVGTDEYILLEKYENQHNKNIGFVATILDRKYLLLQKKYG